jgi:hypothetical protein
MPEESQDEIGTPAEAGEAAIDPSTKVAEVSGQRMAQVLLDMAMAPLLRIQVRGVGRKPVHLDLRMCLHILCDHCRAMGVEPVPDDDEGTRNVSLEVMEGDYDIFSADGMCEVPLVDAARQGQPDHRGKCTAFADASQDRCLPLRSPRGNPRQSFRYICGYLSRPCSEASPMAAQTI